ETNPRSTLRSPLIFSSRPVTLLTPADIYPLALFQSNVTTKIAVATIITPKIAPTHIKGRCFCLVIHRSRPSRRCPCKAQKVYHHDCGGARNMMFTVKRIPKEIMEGALSLFPSTTMELGSTERKKADTS